MVCNNELGSIIIILCCLTILDYEVTFQEIQCTDTDNSDSIRILPCGEVFVIMHV